MDITQLLTFAHREGASDVHLSSGEPPMVRMHGDMKRIEHPPLSVEEVHNMVFDIMSDAVRKTFQEKNDVDFSFELGDLARGIAQRCAAGGLFLLAASSRAEVGERSSRRDRTAGTAGRRLSSPGTTRPRTRR
jgi:hypothetical protein